MHRRFGRLDERHKVHLLTTNRYTTLINSDRGPVSPNPNGNPYDTNIENFMNEEILDPFCWGFVPLNKETEILLKRLGRSPTISGDIITSQEDIYDIYT